MPKNVYDYLNIFNLTSQVLCANIKAGGKETKMTERKSTVGEVVGMVLMLALLVLICAPLALFEMNAHSGVKTEYAMTKVGWLMHPVVAGKYRFVNIRDRATARVVGTARGLSYSALTEEFYVKEIPTDLKQDQRYEFQLRCTKIGTLPDPMTNDLCEVLSIRDRSGARIVQADDPRLIARSR
jgi:hypothetical protein